MRDGSVVDAGWGRTVVGWGVGALLLFTLAALAGYGIFGLNPERIPASLIGFWRISYAFFAQLHILVGAVALGVALVYWAGWRWVPAFLAVYLFSFLSEFFGTGYGIPFGMYEYTSLLGFKIADRVPWVIPLSWFLMAVPAWILARETFPGAARWVPRIVFASILLTLWDLALDPAMSYQAPYYWVWTDTGPYFKMPWVNLAGWLGTGVVLMGAMELLGIREWSRRIPPTFALAYYLVTLLMPLGMIVLEGLWLAVLVTVLAYVAAWGCHLVVKRARSESSGRGRVLGEPA